MGVRCCGYGAGPLAVGVLEEGMGSWRALTSAVLRHLTARGSLSVASIPGFCMRTRRLTTTFLASSPTSNIDEERAGLDRDDDWVEEEGTGGVDATGRGIRGVLGTRYVSCVYCSATAF